MWADDWDSKRPATGYSGPPGSPAVLAQDLLDVLLGSLHSCCHELGASLTYFLHEDPDIHWLFEDVVAPSLPASMAVLMLARPVSGMT